MGKWERQGETDWECSKALTWCSFSLISCWRDRAVACLMENSAASAINRWSVSIKLLRTSFNWRNTHKHTHTRGLLSENCQDTSTLLSTMRRNTGTLGPTSFLSYISHIFDIFCHWNLFHPSFPPFSHVNDLQIVLSPQIFT